MLLIALVGCGSIATYHAKAFAKLTDICRVSVCIDIDETQAKHIAQLLPYTDDIKISTDFDAELQAGSFDAVDLMLPHHLHEQFAVKALKANKHVLLEKPLTCSLAGCKRVLDVAKESSARFMVAENAQYWKEIIAAKQLIDSGAIGDICSVKAKAWETSFNATDFNDDYAEGTWRCDTVQAGGGCLMDSGSHWIRSLRMWLGDVVDVVGVTSRSSLPHMSGESTVQSLIRFNSGIVANLEVLIGRAPMMPQPWFQIQGTKGEIVIDGDFSGGMKLFDETNPSGKEQTKGIVEDCGFVGSYSAEMFDFVDSVVHNKPFAADANQAVCDLRVVLGVYESAQGKGWVNVNDLS